MEPVLFVMAILGCGDGQVDCAEARIEPARYATVEQCRAAMPFVVQRHADLSYPVVAATCRASGTHMASAELSRR